MGLHVQYPLLLSDCIKIEFSRKSFEKYLNVKFLENLSSGSRILPYRQTDGHTDMRKLIVAFRNIFNMSKKLAAFMKARKAPKFELVAARSITQPTATT
jgi:hypothetical protein